MSEPHVLVVTSAGAAPGAVVPVLAAVEAAGMRVRAIDVGGAGGGGGAITDRVRRALLGESAERRLRRELDANPPDVAVVFDPHAATALTVARDQAAAPAPVVGVVGDLEPAREWAQTDCDRLLAIDDEAAVALADSGVEPDRILVVGPLGERAWADAALENRAGIRSRYGLVGTVILVEIAGLGAELTGQIVMQLSLWNGAEQATFLFDGTNDSEVGTVVRSQVPVLGLRGKLFGATAEAPRYWRAADVVVARPRPHAVSRAALVGARLVALVDDTVVGAATVAAALEARGRGVAVKTPLLLSTAIEQAAGRRAPEPGGDGADAVADVLAVVARDKRAVVEERRAVARAATAAKVRHAAAAAAAAARVSATPGALEDLGGAPAPAADGPAPPSKEELGRLRAEVKVRLDQLNGSMLAARTAATEADQQASHARGRGDDATAREHERKAEAERTHMHALLAEMAQLERELGELEAAARAAEAAGVRAPPPGAGAGATASTAPPPPPPRAAPEPDPLGDLKKKAKKDRRSQDKIVEDELAALKRKMAEKKKR